MGARKLGGIGVLAFSVLVLTIGCAAAPENTSRAAESEPTVIRDGLAGVGRPEWRFHSSRDRSRGSLTHRWAAAFCRNRGFGGATRPSSLVDSETRDQLVHRVTRPRSSSP